MENLNAEIGFRISKLRKEKGITQEALSEELSVTTKHVSEIERGISSLSLERLIRAARFLDCSMDYLLLGYDTNSITSMLPHSIIEILISDDQRTKNLLAEYLRMFSRLRESDRLGA